jgi:hypothetical protein
VFFFIFILQFGLHVYCKFVAHISAFVMFMLIMSIKIRSPSIDLSNPPQHTILHTQGYIPTGQKMHSFICFPSPNLSRMQPSSGITLLGCTNFYSLTYIHLHLQLHLPLLYDLQSHFQSPLPRNIFILYLYLPLLLLPTRTLPIV